jgi:hypothetical protein
LPAALARLETGGDGVAHRAGAACHAVALFDVGNYCCFNPARRCGEAEVVQQQCRRQDGGGGVGFALSGDVRG